MNTMLNKTRNEKENCAKTTTLSILMLMRIIKKKTPTYCVHATRAAGKINVLFTKLCDVHCVRCMHENQGN